jgi:hypothetical protein
MKWEKPNGSTQVSSDGMYCIVHANSQHWVAYELTKFSTGNELGVRSTDELARQCCEDHARVSA